MLKKSEDMEIVLVPLHSYEELLNKIEELEDLADHKESIAAYNRGEGRSFREFLREHRDQFDVQD